MTVACYDGETLAADRMSRVTGEDGGRKVKSLVQDKIRADFPDTKFGGEKVYAVARAGRLKVSLALVDIMTRSGDMSKDLSKVEAKLKKRIPEEKMANAALLVMTAKHVFVVRASKNYKVTCQKEDRSKKIAIGTGKAVAEMLMRQLGVSAIDAVAASELQHESCGGGVSYTTRIKSVQRNPISVQEGMDKDKLRRLFLRNVISSAKAQMDRVA